MARGFRRRAVTDLRIRRREGCLTDYARRVRDQLVAAGFRAHLDDRNEKLQAKIRDAQLAKVPYMLVVGPKEAASHSVSVRSHGDLGPRPLGSIPSESPY